MGELVCTVPVPKTTQELEQAVQYYKTHELNRDELFCQWQAIRSASLEQTSAVMDDDIPGEDSY